MARRSLYIFMSSSLTFLFMLVFLLKNPPVGVQEWLFSLAAHWVYATIFISLATVWLTFSFWQTRRAVSKPVRYIHEVLLVLLPGAVHLVVLADLYLFEIYGFHVNGFVLNIIFTPGGIESLGANGATYRSLILTTVGVLGLQYWLLLLTRYCDRVLSAEFLGTFSRYAAVVFFGLLLIEQGIFGIADVQGDSRYSVAAESIPFYQATTFRKIAKRMGFDVVEADKMHAAVNESKLNYPLAAVDLKHSQQTQQPLNVIWLVAESWRWDMLDPEIMPETWLFAKKATRFTQHYSTGNGTRMGIFGMFYGLPGNYWFPILNRKTPPLIMDYFRANDYQTQLFTSAKFSYPEFDQTVFAGVDPAKMQEYYEGEGWSRDQRNVTDLLSFVATTDKDKPFFTFMFFESPHAPYFFPETNVLRENYLKDLDYIEMNLDAEIESIKNRYVNACHHLDSQYSRVIRYLEENGLLDNTIVLLTGDHGEEFMEAGRWGHNSQFSNPQIRVPMVLYSPKNAGQVYTSMSSHMDIAPMLLDQLGVKVASQNYSDGLNLLVGGKRDSTLVASWTHIGYVEDTFKFEFPYRQVPFAKNKVWSLPQDVVTNDPVIQQQMKLSFAGILGRLSRFQ